jgi:hypothetical protein
MWIPIVVNVMPARIWIGIKMEIRIRTDIKKMPITLGVLLIFQLQKFPTEVADVLLTSDRIFFPWHIENILVWKQKEKQPN